MFRLWIGVALLASSCATSSYKKVDLKGAEFAGLPLEIVNDVPFVQQDLNVCGPTALFMATKSLLPNLTVEDAKGLIFTPSASGTYKQDLLAGARRLGVAPYAVRSVPEIFTALADGEPVLIFHRTRFLGKEYWHYSVLTGFDREHENFRVHIGDSANRSMDVSRLNGAWEEGGKWAYVFTRPSVLPAFATYDESLENALAFLRVGLPDAAREISQATRARFPTRYESDVVLAEALMKTQHPEEALLALERASKLDPKNQGLKLKARELASRQSRRTPLRTMRRPYPSSDSL